jgi:Na+/H+ antiporter NhaA
MALLLLTLLLVKHFVLDFYYQPPYMWQNKGTFGHWGGIAHSGIHAVVTYVILSFFIDAPDAAILAAFEFVVHYLTDWAKMNINRIKGRTATTHNEFWQLTGFDQLVHQLTYVAILYMVTV